MNVEIDYPAFFFKFYKLIKIRSTKMNKDFKIYISILQTLTINAGRNCNLVAQYPAKFTVFSEF